MSISHPASSELTRSFPEVPGQRFVFHEVSWRFYQIFLAEVGEQPLRLTYDRGTLEVMTLSYHHEQWKRRLGRLIETLTEELNIPIASGGSTTFNREDLERGLEPDECYYIRHEPRVRGKATLNLSEDPPPDLVIEIDISNSSLNRQTIYAALGVPELWRFEGERLEVYCLGEDGAYERSTRSLSFPFLPLAELGPFLRPPPEIDETSLVRSFRSWIRERLLPDWNDPKP